MQLGDDALLSDFVARAERAAEARTPRPLHFICVLDNSGSMHPFQALLRACSAEVLRVLPAGATVGFVTFSDAATTAMAPAPVVAKDKDSTSAAVAAHITTSGHSTNIHAAVVRALDLAAEHHERDNGAVHVVFLTDGAANSGTTKSSAGIYSAAASHRAFTKTAFHCIGFGDRSSPVGADLLARLAHATHATYNHVVVAPDDAYAALAPDSASAAADLAAAFGDCFGRALMTLATRVAVRAAEPWTWITPHAASGTLVLAHNESRVLVASAPASACVREAFASEGDATTPDATEATQRSFRAALAWTCAQTGASPCAQALKRSRRVAKPCCIVLVCLCAQGKKRQTSWTRRSRLRLRRLRAAWRWHTSCARV